MQTPASAAGATGRPEGGPGGARSSDLGKGSARSGASWWRVGGNVLLVFARAGLTLSLVALLAVVVLYLRLLQGPIVLPGLAEIAADRINEASGEVRVSAADAILSLGEGDIPAGLRFRQVEVGTPDGQRLFTAPRIAARFHLSDLLRGRVQPVRIRLFEPDLQIIRAEDGRLRFGLGQGGGIALGAGGSSEAGMDAIARMIDGFVGDEAPVPALAKLERIAIVGANVAYDDRLGEGDWRTAHATLRIVRYEGGARATMEVDAAQDDPPGAAVRMLADRRAGSGRTDLQVRFGRVAAADIARQSRQLEWLALIGGTVEGEVSATLERDGRLGGLHGTIISENGIIRGLEQPTPFDIAQLRFRVDPARERLLIDDFRLSAEALEAGLTGFADLRRDAAGGFRGLAGQFDIGALHIDLPELFADPLAFDGGRITARWALDRDRIDVVGGRLAKGDLVFTVEGQARATEEGWVTDLRAAAEGMTVDDLVAFWPLAAALNARTWIDEHIPVGQVDRLTAQLRIGSGDPQIALDFDYSGLRAEYVGEMSPIEEASGTGHVTFNDLFLDISAGHVEPIPGERIDLGGSSMVISGFWGGVTPADIALKAEGPTRGVLALIDEEPLRLVSRLGQDLGPVAGRTRVEADLVIPLLKDLKLAQIDAEAQAALTDVAMSFALEPGRSVQVAAERLNLVADTEALRISGDARVDGAPLALDWQENYGPGEGGRVLSLSGTATPVLLATLGANDLPLDGAPPFELSVRQSGDGPLEFGLEADLTPARLEVAALDWVKERGVPARLSAEGVQGDGGLDIRSLRLDSPALDARGGARLTEDGALVRADFSEIRMAGLGTFAATLAPGSDGVLEVRLTGPRLDLSERVGEAGSGGQSAAEPVRLSFEIAELRLSEKVALTPAQGNIQQSADGGLSGRIEGMIGAAPLEVELAIPGSGPGRVDVTSPNAGAALRAAGLYPGAEGGALWAKLVTGTADNPGLRGEARIEDVVVHSDSTFRDVLREGGLAEAEAEVSSGGIRFRRVVVPFSYRGDIITLTDAIATSPLLAVKLNGTVNEATDRLDLVGVLSPAYVLTGALNEVPLLGQILGGRGEGILAMTFRLQGDTEDPRFTVNPLSLLAPGFLRRVFSEPRSEPSEDFQDRITRQAR